MLFEKLLQFLEKIGDGIERFDNKLLDAVEWISHRIQRLTGKDCFWLAELCALALLGIIVIGTGCQIAVAGSGAEIANDLIFAFISSGVLLWFCHSLLRKREKNWRENPQFLNRSRADSFDQALRLMWLFFSYCNTRDAWMDGTIDSWVWAAYSIIMAAFLYLIACTPLPPRKNLVRKWLEKAQEALAPSSDALPDPVPS